MSDTVVALGRRRGGFSGVSPFRIPDAFTMWARALLVAAVVLALYLLDRLSFVFLDAWMLESLGFEDVFWTNFRAGALLFVWGLAGTAAGVSVPALTSDIDPRLRRIILTIGMFAGLLGGYLLAMRYQQFLLLFGALPVGETDPVFGNDVGFYMFRLPALWTIWTALVIPLALGLVSSVVCFHLATPREGHPFERNGLLKSCASLTSPLALLSLAALGVLAAVAIWLSRYEFLWAEGDAAAYFNGADYIDAVGLFSYINYASFSSLLVALFTGFAVFQLLRMRDSVGRGEAYRISANLRRLGYGAALLVAVDFAFAGIVAFRDSTLVSPNEPVIQLPFIERHIAGTKKGWDLENVESVELIPLDANDALPTAADLMQSATLKNAPLWPGWVSYLERLLDPQHADRVLLTAGDPTVYGPTLDIFRAQQKLRSYYDFLDVDTVRYSIDGEKRLFVSAVRELPLADPQDWINHWGQRMLLYTHGHGLVMAPAAEVRGEGEPNYATSGIPMQSRFEELLPENPAVYYGQGAGPVMAFSNAKGINELNIPTDEGREEIAYPPSIEAGISVDSFLKRLVIGWRSGVAVDVWFSDLIAGGTRVHYIRRPLDRLERIAPFLFLDSNATAVVHAGRIVWLVNGITTNNNYPYSWRWYLGDKSTDQHFEDRDVRLVNYARDSVKAVVDGYTGEVTLYQIADEPVVNSWASIYPSLFTPGAEMPEGIRAHLQYPQELFHVQFDDLYILYHMQDALTYFNLEDMWDDADEVKGPVIGEGEAITFSIEPRHWIAETGDVLPASSEGTQFAQSMVFTNEHALNLRAVATVYQDGADYGRMVVMQVPKGHFSLGPEQADAVIDQEPDISEQISWWNRMGSEVIRGHTSTLILGREVIYVEPLFTRSKQNPVPQMQRVIVVFRGSAADGENLGEALEHAIEKVRRRQAADTSPQAASRPAQDAVARPSDGASTAPSATGGDAGTSPAQ